jgi:hypothetical protein
MIFRLYLASLVLLLGTSCKKERSPLEQLPAATQSGANTMGCLVDGELFRPVSENYGIKPISVSRFSTRDMDIAFTRQEDDAHRGIILFLDLVRGPGTYPLDQVARINFSGSPSYGYYKTYTPEPDRKYVTGPDVSGQVIITRLDTVAKVVAGTFEFTARQLNGTATVRVTDGRFDLHYPQ